MNSLEERLERLGTRLDRDGQRIERQALPARESVHLSLSTRTQTRHVPRSRVVVAAVVVFAVIVGVTGWFLTRDTDRGHPRISTPATNAADTTTNAGLRACAAFRDAATRPQSGRSTAAMIRRIDVQASDCGSSVYFLAGAGKWNVRYSSATSTMLIAQLAGASAYEGPGIIPDSYQLASPSVVTDMTRLRHQNDANDPGTTWSIQLDKRYPFTAGQVRIGGTDVFAINIAAPSTTLSCRVAPNIDIAIPTGWYTGTVDTCHFLSPEPIAYAPFVGDNAAVHLITGLQTLHIQEIGDATQEDLGTTTINGRQATRTLYTNTDSATGTVQDYQVVIQWEAGTSLVVSGLTRPFPPGAPSRDPISLTDVEAAVDAIADSASAVP